MSTSSEQIEKTGVPENKSLMVKQVAGEWTVEDQVGDNLGNAKSRDEAINIAREAKKAGKGSIISIYTADGGLEKTIDE